MSKPSEVFLDLWQWRALDQSPEKFAECAAAWRQIVSLEEIYAAAKQKEAIKDFLDSWRTQPVTPLVPADTWPGPITCEARSKVDTNGQEGTGGDTSSGAAAPPSPQGEGITYDCASAPMTDEAEAAWAAAEAEAKAREAANRSAGAKAGVATRKRNLTEKLEDLRRRGVKMHEIAWAAGNGLTINDVMDALEAKPMSPMKIQALEKAARKLEEAEGSGGE